MIPRYRWHIWCLGLWLLRSRRAVASAVGAWLMRKASLPEWFGGPLDDDGADGVEGVPF